MAAYKTFFKQTAYKILILLHFKKRKVVESTYHTDAEQMFLHIKFTKSW